VEISEIIELPEAVTFDLIVLGEDISKGQEVHSFTIEVWVDGNWEPLTEGNTIGYKRILKTGMTTADKLKFTFNSDKGEPMISTFGLYLESR